MSRIEARPPNPLDDEDLARWQREMKMLNEPGARGGDKTPLVIRVLLGAAMLAIVAGFFGALAWWLLEARAGVR